MLKEFLPEYPKSLNDQVTFLLDLNHNDLPLEERYIVFESIRSLEEKPIGSMLAKSEPILKRFVGCMVDYVNDMVLQTGISLLGWEANTLVHITDLIRNAVLVPAVEKDPYAILQARLIIGENPFIPKREEQNQILINHDLIKIKLTMSLN